MRRMLLFVFLGVLFTSKAQIMNDQIHLKPATQFYFETTRAKVFRELTPNANFLAVPLGQRAFETPLTAWSHQLGIQTGLSKHIIFDGALSWMQNGESYTWQSSETDSSFSYQTRYRYLALPLHLKYSFGQKISIYTGAGLIPALYQSYRQDVQWTNALGAKYDNQIKVNNNMNSFTISWSCVAGMEIPMNASVRLRFGVQFRQQLNNSYNPYQDYIHKSKAICFNFGLSKKI